MALEFTREIPRGFQALPEVDTSSHKQSAEGSRYVSSLHGGGAGGPHMTLLEQHKCEIC